MKITVFGTAEDFSHVKTLAETLPVLQYRKLIWGHAENYDALLESHRDAELTIVMQDGAEGMEGAMLIRRLLPDTPVIWFSEDVAFGAQAHRLGCAYFGEKPITMHAMERAIRNAIA